MQTYSEYAPTGFDRPGAFLADQGDWLVVSAGRNRDSGPLDESNFHAALALLGGEGDNVEVHRFGHWACGWFEIIIVRPDTGGETAADKIESRLADYPALDDEDFSEREYELASDYWADMGLSGRVEACRDAGVSIFAARTPHIPECLVWDVHDCGSVYFRAE